MRLKRLELERFKNLGNFAIDFGEDSPYTVLVGENGAGKSNLLEALTWIFRALDLEEDAPFDYKLSYSCREWDLEIEANAGKSPVIEKRRTGQEEELIRLSRREFMAEDEEGQPLYRPAFVFGYYSGTGRRLSSLYSRHRDRYYEEIIKPPERRNAEIADPNALRRLFFAENLHGQFALIAFFMASGSEADADRHFLREHLMIDGLDSVLFALKQPEWSKAKRSAADHFWKAEGEVREFVELLYEQALLPLRMKRRMESAVKKPRPIENLYLFLPHLEALQAVYKPYGNQYRFFTALESTDLSLMLAEVRTRVRMRPEAGGGEVTYRDLSEGEQQLLLVLGLLKFTARSESLFLLDEPDTHLNPAWSTRYLEFLNDFIPDPQSCGIVMATHDPLVFSSLEREQVRIISRDGQGSATAEVPLQDPRGMGIQAILASDLFRLPSGGLDPPTVRELDKQRRLSAATDLSPAEERELAEVTKSLEERGFWKSARDPVDQLFREKFIPRWLALGGEVVEGEEAKPLTVEQTHRREEIAEEIAAEIAAEIASEEAG
jgi:predicted ATPase